MNGTIKRLIKKRTQCYDVWKKYNDSTAHDKYNQLKKDVNQAMKEAHGDYVRNIFDVESETPVKKLWGYVKSLKVDRIGMPSFIWNSKLMSQAKQKAEALSQQNKSVFTVEDLKSMLTKGPSSWKSMADIEINVNGVEKLLASLNPKKAIGPDKVSTWMLKTFAPTIAPILQSIFIQSLSSGEVPLDWKTAKISAIYKKGERSDSGNYRPVSLTSLPCKIREHILSSNIRRHLDENNILSPSQRGFRKNLSCETQLLTTLEDLAKRIG